MNTKRILGLVFLAALSACEGQCSCGTTGDDDGDTGSGGTGGQAQVTVGVTSTVTGTGGAGGAGSGGDPTGTGGAGTGGDAPVVDPTIRFLHLSGDAADVNFCLKEDGGDTVGPLVEGGLTYTQASAFGSPVSPGNYSVVIVEAEAEDCTGDAPSFGPFSLGDGDTLTLAAIGLVDGAGDEALDVARYDEALEYPAEGFTTLRFVHAAPGAPAVDIGEYDEAHENFVPYFLDASYPNDSGYSSPQAIPTFDSAVLTARAAGSESDLIDIDVEGADGAIVNAYAILDPDAALGVGVTFIVDSPVN